MYLVADGDRRTFRYYEPRALVARAGVERDTILFEGRKIGDTYRGTAYLYSSRCARASYPVSGPVTNDGDRVILTGRAPKRNDSCAVTGSRDDRMVFEFRYRGRM